MNKFILSILLLSIFTPLLAGETNIIISADSVSGEKGEFIIMDGGRYHAGDNPAWKEYYYDDSNWKTGNPSVIPDTWDTNEWKGIGWFRYKFDVDSSLWGKPIALHHVQAGASEFYLNGRLVHRFGRVGKYVEMEEAYWDQNFPEVFTFDSLRYQVLSIRYSNFTSKKIQDYGYGTGFYFSFSDIESGIDDRAERDSIIYFMTALFTSVPLIFALLHLSIFVFYRKDIANLYFGIIALCLSLTNFFDFYIQLSGSPEEYLIYNLLRVFPVVITLIFLLLFTYESFLTRIPKHFILFLIAGILLQFWAIFGTGGKVSLQLNIYGVVTLVEIFRVIIFGFVKRNVKMNILIFGFLFFVTTLAFQIGSRFGFNLPVVFEPLYFLGIIVLIITMSIHLSKNFAQVNRNLEKEVQRVKELSEQKLLREREERENEITRKLLEADNSRKTEELNQARMLQMSMIPEFIPDFPGYNIATFIQTATEVGGDYYDFHRQTENSFTMAIGDATGHGMKAGTLVTSTKSLFNALVKENPPLDMIKKCNAAIKYMNLPSLYMSLSVVNFTEEGFEYCSAGMPPVLVFRAATGILDTYIQKSMPLGGFIDFAYTSEFIKIESGDIILFSSDGFMELFDASHEMLGLEGMKRYFRESITDNPKEIINNLTNRINIYSDNTPLHDDLTLIVVKKQ